MRLGALEGSSLRAGCAAKKDLEGGISRTSAPTSLSPSAKAPRRRRTWEGACRKGGTTSPEALDQGRHAAPRWRSSPRRT